MIIVQGGYRKKTLNSTTLTQGPGTPLPQGRSGVHQPSKEEALSSRAHTLTVAREARLGETEES